MGLVRWLTVMVLALTASRAYADEPALAQKAKKAKVEVELLSELNAVAPGETFRVAMRFVTEPEWHVYWKNPGALGLPTELTFEAPDGWDFGAIAFPTPHRIVSKIGDVSFGYENELILMSEVRVPENALEGQSVPVLGKASWLICKENCIQGSAELGVKLAVASTPRAERANATVVKTLDEWQARIPLVATHVDVPKRTVVSELPPAKPGQPFVLKVTFEGPITLGEDLAATFIPATPDGLEVTSIEKVDGDPRSVRIKGDAGPMAEPLVSKLEGVFQVRVADKPLAFDATMDVPRAAGPAVGPSIDPAPKGADPTPTLSSAHGSICDQHIGKEVATGEEGLSSIWLALLFAFIGGIILNAMPCVLPVLSLKVLGLVQQAADDKKVIWRHGLVYTAGVLVSFLVFGIVLIAIQASSSSEQLQSPVFMAVIIAVLFAFALSLFGVFELSLPFAGQLDAAVARSHGYGSSFTYGIFAVLLGTPCTAPFLGPALAYAFLQPPAVLLMLLLATGLGMAFPFLLMAAFPVWRRIVPKPGPWLDTFKKLMGFMVLGTALFFMATFAAQVSREAFFVYLTFLGSLAFALFVYGHWAAPVRGPVSRTIGSLVALALIVVNATFVSTQAPPAPPKGATVLAGGIEWHSFDDMDVEARAASGTTLFIDFTADWCTTCKVNEATAIFTDDVRRAFDELDVLAVRGDFTKPNDAIKRWLARFNQPSVPLYVIIPAHRPQDAFALPSLISTDDVVGGVCKAGASTTTTASR